MESVLFFRRGFYSCCNWVAGLHHEVSLTPIIYCESAGDFDFLPEGIEAEEEKVCLALKGKETQREDSMIDLISDPAPEPQLLFSAPDASSFEHASETVAAPQPEDVQDLGSVLVHNAPSRDNIA
ncbi:hypothetical protein CFOL_v3_24754 [Cephalotus follicularis]|uniref:Uncharacterized protein n=1 Tax=Cephalotus follicularis TaxID=3775 RepID=A0A1Q3CM10_CEPFO|nr:hypothetical protein CFOL_v3_24754 [Cephalotus follicularis]